MTSDTDSRNEKNGEMGSPALGIVLLLVGHGALLFWGISSADSAVLALPGGKLLVWAAASALIATAVLAVRRTSVSLLVVPAALNAALSLVGLDAAAEGGTSEAVGEAVRVGALGVAVSLSMASVSVGHLQPSPLSALGVRARSPLRVGLAVLVAIVVWGLLSGRLHFLPTLFAFLGVVSISVIAAEASASRLRMVTMVELLAATLFSMGAVWSACVVVGVENAQGDAGSLPAMRLAWLSAFAVLAATAQAILPRVAAFGAGVLCYPRVALGVGLGVALCVVMARGASQNAFAASERLEAAVAETPRPSSRTGAPPKTSVQGAATSVRASTPALPQPPDSDSEADHPSTGSATPEASSNGDGTVPGPTLADTDARVTSTLALDGPLAIEDAVTGLGKGMARILGCYKESKSMGSSLRARLRLRIGSDGSVKQANPDIESTEDEELLTCLALSLYRVGLAGAPRPTNVELVLDFSPAS